MGKREDVTLAIGARVVLYMNVYETWLTSSACEIQTDHIWRVCTVSRKIEKRNANSTNPKPWTVRRADCSWHSSSSVALGPR